MRALIQMHLALATIAAAMAFLAEMVIAGVLGAPHADMRGFFAANAAQERHGCYFFLPGGGPDGWLNRNARQRCASLSITV